MVLSYSLWGVQINVYVVMGAMQVMMMYNNDKQDLATLLNIKPYEVWICEFFFF